MTTQHTLTRRGFLQSTIAVTISASLGRTTDAAEAELLRIGVRAASLQMVGTPDVFRVAASIPGIHDVELQTTAGRPNLRDDETVRLYKREAGRWGLTISSLAGIWDRGVTINSPRAAANIVASIRAAQMLGAGVILAAFFRKDALDMAVESSYGPVVSMLQGVAPRAASAGVVIGLENSLSPADNKKLVDLVDHPAVGVYYDPYNMAIYGHGDDAIPGIKLLGKKRIFGVHLKNGNRLLEEPGPIDWATALRDFHEIKYDGWYVYESGHDSTADCVADTKKNNAFLQHVLRQLDSNTNGSTVKA